MTALRLHQITAVGDDEYELVFEGPANTTERMRALVLDDEEIPGIKVRPDLFMAGRVDNARAVTAAVVACHRARTGTVQAP
jgi:hypothetical protein